MYNPVFPFMEIRSKVSIVNIVIVLLWYFYYPPIHEIT